MEMTEAPTSDDFKQVMCSLEEDAEFDQLIWEYFAPSGALYQVAVQIMVAKSLFWNLQHYTTKLQDTNIAQPFKDAPNRGANSSFACVLEPYC